MTQPERCNLCGAPVRVVGDPREGTMHYEHMTQTEAELRLENSALRSALRWAYRRAEREPGWRSWPVPSEDAYQDQVARRLLDER